MAAELGHPELVQKLIARIEREGPISFADFMEMALYDPEFGYYVREARIGAAGDYWTSPEVHRIFAELVGRQITQASGVIAPDGPFMVIEIGAGNGTFAGNLLKALKREHPALADRLQYLIIERSAALEQRQRDYLGPLQEEGIPIRWLRDLADLSSGAVTGVIFSNELVDAFPVHRVVQRRVGLQELFVDWSGRGFTEIEAPPGTPALERYFERLGVRLEEGQQAEINLEALSWMRQVAACLSKGIVLTIDYGHTAADLYSPVRKTGTLLCYYRATVCDDPYIRIGQQDMTAHVDFTSLALTGREAGLEVTGFTNQVHFLLGLGIESAFRDLEPESTDSESMRRLLRPDGMGSTFKVLLQHKGIPAPALDGLKTRPFVADALYAGADRHG
ncbi:MAG TPA: SAM-dependent methyltransferase [Nitrospirales bacterium]